MDKVKKKKSKKRVKAKDVSGLEKTIQLQYLFEYGVNIRDRVITFSQDIGDGSFEIIDCALSEMEASSHKPITLRIHSMGGSVYDAIAMLGRIKSSPCEITTEGYGTVMSAATLILAGGHKRKISRFCWFMHHESSYEIGGKHSEVKLFVKHMEREEHLWSRWMAEFTNKPESFWYQLGAGGDKYFTAEELIDLGVADEIF